jgi:hippurate hydrolase
VYNEEKLAVRAEQVFRAALGDAQVGPAEKSLAGEDFGLFSRGNVPILLFRLGSVSETKLAAWHQQGKTPPSLHSPEYCIDAGETIETGVVAMSSLLLDLLK